jgi:hypothetical protein
LLRQGWLRLAFRFGAAGLALIAVLYIGLRIYSVSITHRAINLLDETASIRIGMTEDSILPLVVRYGAVKWKPETPLPVDDCVSKADCEYRNAHVSDYAYEVDLSPFNVAQSPERSTGRVHRLMAALMYGTDSSWRNALSLRDWTVFAQIKIRGGRVCGVYSGVFVEGRTRWLGDTWVLSDRVEMPNPDKRSLPYVVEGSALTFPGNGGAGVIQNLTPAATAEQSQVAHSFNGRCLSGILPCRRLCDLAPRTFNYVNEHPEAGNIVSTDGCLKSK